MYREVASILFLIVLFVPAPIRAAVNKLDLPVMIPDQQWRPLYEAMDDELQQKLETRLRKNRRWATLLGQRKMAVGLVDLTNPSAPRFAHINGSTMMYAASLPKIVILLACAQAFEDGAMTETPEVIDDLNQMIRVSSNGAAARMFERVGFERISAVLTHPQYQLYDPRRGGGLWVGKPYGKSGVRYPDPLEGLSHGATATQVCRFYYLLATGRLINTKRSKQMLDCLVAPDLHHKFVSIVEQREPNAQIYRKSGTWKNWHSDSMLVWGNDWRRYILVGLVDDVRGEQILRDLVPAIEGVLGH